MQRTEQHNSLPPIDTDESIDVKKWIVLILSYWYVFMICIIASGVACYYINRTIIPEYSTKSTVLMEEQKTNSRIGAQAVMQDFGVGAYTNVNNQTLLLKSYSMMRKAVSKLDLDFSYYFEQKLRRYHYYKNAPVIASVTNKEVIPSGTFFSVTYIDDHHFKLNVNDDDIINERTSKIAFGDTVQLAGYKLVVNKTNTFSSLMPEVFFKYNSRESLVAEFSARTTIAFVADDATIVEIGLVGENPRRDVDFLNTLVQEFLNSNLERKNIEAIRTIDFITKQLYDVADSLAISENELQSYRSENNIINISAQADMLITKADALETEKATLNIKKNYYKYLKELIENGNDKNLMSPSTVGLDDPLLSTYIARYTEIQHKRQMLAPKAPYRAVATAELKELKESIYQTTDDAIKKTDISILSIDNQIRGILRKTETLPATERRLLGIQRQLTVNDTYYTYLLQKRSEAQIQQASNSPDNILIDEARTISRTNGKETRLNYIIALLLGGGLPLGIIILGEVLNSRIRCRKDIEDATSIPILGSIAHKTSYNKITTLDSPRSSFTESFRALRTRLSFLQAENKCMSVMITSSLSGEGKTFIAINLAGIYALSGKKTVLVGYDLRKPKIADYLGKRQKYGLSNYLVGNKSIDDITVNYRTNLDIIYSGTIPPNPGELCASDKRNKELFKTLKEKYDIIIIDSTPIGAVTDAFLTGQHADTTLFIAKHNHTDKDVFGECIKQLELNNIKNANIVVNDISIKQSTYKFGRYVYGKKYNYMYGYSGGYGYGYGYGNEYGYTDA